MALTVQLDDLHPDRLPQSILDDPFADIYRSSVPIGAEDVEKEINSHIAHHIESADSAKRSAVYETVSNAPVIVNAFLGDMHALMAFAKTIPVYYEFYRGYDEGNNDARHLSRAKKMDEAFRARNGRSDARIYHALGLELTSDPEMLNRRIDTEREEQIEARIKNIRPLGIRFKEARAQIQRNFERATKIMAESPFTGAKQGLNKLGRTTKQIGRAIASIDYKTAVIDFAKGSGHDIIKLAPSYSGLKSDLLSIKKSDIQELRIGKIYRTFHAANLGILGTFCASTIVELKQARDHLIYDPIKKKTGHDVQEWMEQKLDQAAYYASNVTIKPLKKLAQIIAKPFQKESPPIPVNDNAVDDDDDFTVKSTPAEKPINLHRTDREFQRIMRARRSDLISCAWNTAAKAGETYFVYDVTKLAYKSLSTATSAGDYTTGAFYAGSTILAAAALNHICKRRLHLFNHLSSARSQMALKDVEKTSLGNNMRIIVENIDHAHENTKISDYISTAIDILERMKKIERRSFEEGPRENIRVFLRRLSDDVELFPPHLEEQTQELKTLLGQIDRNYFDKLPSPQISTPLEQNSL